MAELESLTQDERVRLVRELFDPEGCVNGFVAAIADHDPHLLPAATDLAGFDEAPYIRLMRLYDLVESDPVSSFNGYQEESYPVAQEPGPDIANQPRCLECWVR